MRLPPAEEARIDPGPVRTRSAQVWRPSPSARPPGIAQPLPSQPPCAQPSHVGSEIVGVVHEQLEQISALNARIQRLLGLAAITLGVLTLGVICLAGLIIAA